MRWLQNKYTPFFILSLLLHIALVVFLFTSVIFSSYVPYVVKKGDAKTVVHGTVVNQNQVEQVVERLKQQQREQRHAEQEHVQKMRELARQAERQREDELEHLKQLRRQQKEMQEKQLVEQKLAQQKIAELKKQAVIEQKQLAAKAKAVKEQRVIKHHKELAENKVEQQQTTQEERKKDADDLLQQQLSQEQRQLTAARQQYMNGEVNKYNALIIQAIRQNWIVPTNIDSTLKVKVQIRLGDGGVVLDAEVTESSGNVGLDRSAITAIYKASPLPVPTNADLFNQFRQFSMTMTPGDKVT